MWKSTSEAAGGQRRRWSPALAAGGTFVGELTVGDATVTQLTAPLPISMPAVSRHLKVLEGAGLISRSREGKWQRSHLEAVPLREAAVWIERFRGFWDSSLDRLDAHLATLQKQESR